MQGRSQEDTTEQEKQDLQIKNRQCQHDDESMKSVQTGIT